MAKLTGDSFSLSNVTLQFQQAGPPNRPVTDTGKGSSSAATAQPGPPLGPTLQYSMGASADAGRSQYV